MAFENDQVFKMKNPTGVEVEVPESLVPDCLKKGFIQLGEGYPNTRPASRKAISKEEKMAAAIAQGLIQGGMQSVQKPKEIKAVDKQPSKPVSAASGTIEALKAEYFNKFNKKPYHGWTAEQLQAKINE